MWLCYFHALQKGDINKVVPINKSSTILTAILGKISISGVDSNLGTAIRTTVVLVMAWLMVFMKGKQHEVSQIEKKELLFIGLSGIATGASFFLRENS